ncbi:carbohydrate kinase [Bombiscardovia nodaiensis]|uniref:Carbohydrate kinase n=1 Tax=Bombiscardovia nodaiensis TaxID=2932181 RepID=A0ABM8B8N5_9BIFI|nr:carbohydrate kinase [Bombiscardovia nodaiensis]
MEEIDVVVAGTVFNDLVFSGVQIPKMGTEVFAQGFALAPGGAANRAVAAARLGARSALVTRFGSDALSTLTRHQLEQEPNLDLASSILIPNWQGPTSAALADGFDRAFVTYWDQQSNPEWKRDQPVKVLHIGLSQDLPQWAQDLRKRGTLLVGGVGWDPSQEWSSALLDRLKGVDIVILNETEALNYTSCQDLETALDCLTQVVDQAVITLGSQGLVASCAGERFRLPALAVQAVDPTGAGDVFTAGYMAATAWGWSFENRLQLASAAAACSVTHLGGASAAPGQQAIGQLLLEQARRGRIALPDWEFLAQWSGIDSL